MTHVILNNNGISISAGEITIYNFDGSTREFLSSSIIYLSVGVGIPANSCIDVPLLNKTGYAIFRSSDYSKWEYIEDHRSETIFNTETGQGIFVSDLGNYPNDTTTIAPKTPYDKWDGSQWITDVNAQRVENIAIADKQKSHRLQEAQATISLWQSELQLGIISDEDKASLIAWLAYIKALKAVDVRTLPTINWPDLPKI